MYTYDSLAPCLFLHSENTSHFSNWRSKFTRKPGTSSYNERGSLRHVSRTLCICDVSQLLLYSICKGTGLKNCFSRSFLMSFFCKVDKCFLGQSAGEQYSWLRLFVFLACKQALVSGQSSCFLAFYFGAWSSLRTTRVTRGSQRGVSGGGSVLVYLCTKE